MVVLLFMGLDLYVILKLNFHPSKTSQALLHVPSVVHLKVVHAITTLCMTG